MTRFFVCKFCNRKIHATYIAQHAIRQHVDRLYTVVEVDSQTVFEIVNDELTGKIQITKEELNKKLGFSVEPKGSTK